MASGGVSALARKAYASQLNIQEPAPKKQKYPDAPQRLSCPHALVFTDEDLEGVTVPHDDALVVVAIISNFMVKKILVDSGLIMRFTIVVTFFALFAFSFLHGSSSTTTKHYIVYMGDHSYPDSDSVISANHQMLASVVGSIDGAQQAVVHHYTKSFRGFSAMLTEEQAEKLSESESVVSVFESHTIHLHTTHSWEFLRVDSINQYNQLPIDVKSDMIIGVIDTGKEFGRKPIAKISRTVTVLKTRPAPVVASFSSKGPNKIAPSIIKPDITAPGVNILAAWSPVATAETAGRPVDYNIISGTSMACPHVSAIAAIIKSVHPSWSPAAIQSAIMTTATVLDNTQRPILSSLEESASTPFDYGSGHVNPVAALDPGLVYDFNFNDAYDFICNEKNITLRDALRFTGKYVPCKNPPVPIYNLNYPSIGVTDMSGSLSVDRTVTYYGEGPTVYVASVMQPPGVNVMVRPNQLKFSKAGDKKSFMIDFKPYKDSNGRFVSGELIWSNLNGVHRVRSPIVLHVLSV
ncbi:PREDICTED: subtilisin-like protease Glyma18g48580 [Nelumbo nucifera]|uniref:Subtilisin-like protease Glyma18g48580 n=1 Tax=Nelumbo nucifera TaxID=4432 RepID=A0A1U7ZKN2_NELNU|nr:PREDICTED: subtilisin-like protease Glyma18g48580 [Nelumbo nucifera]